MWGAQLFIYTVYVVYGCYVYYVSCPKPLEKNFTRDTDRVLRDAVPRPVHVQPFLPGRKHFRLANRR